MVKRRKKPDTESHPEAAHQSNNPKVSRRGALVLGALGIIGLLSAAYKIHNQRPDPGYQHDTIDNSPAEDASSGDAHLKYGEWYARLSPEEGEEFFDPSFRPTANIDDLAKSVIFEELERKIPHLPDIHGVRYSYRRTFTAAAIDDRVFKEYCKRSMDSVIGFFDYIGIPDLVPAVSFHVAQKGKPMKASTSSSLTLNVVGAIYDNYTALYTASEGIGWHIGGTDIEASLRNKATYGEMKVDYSIDFRTDGLVAKADNYGIVLASFANGVVATYTSPPAEICHYVLSRWTAEHISKDMTRLWKEEGMPNELQIEALNKVIELWLLREEAVVHGLLASYLLKQRNEMGLSEYEVREYIRSQETNPRYKESGTIMKMLQRTGPEEILAAYGENPMLLFK